MPEDKDDYQVDWWAVLVGAVVGLALTGGLLFLFYAAGADA